MRTSISEIAEGIYRPSVYLPDIALWSRLTSVPQEHAMDLEQV